MNSPAVWEYAVLAALGVLLGAFVNWAVAFLSFDPSKDFGPWRPPIEGGHRNWLDRLPILGWWLLRREAPAIGKLFWLLPLSIELLAAIVLPVFWHWSRMGGGYPGEWIEQLNAPAWSSVWMDWGLIRFIAAVVLLVGMAVATVIDFQEKLIPDEITIPGTLLGLAFACSGWNAALPIRSDSTTGEWTVAMDFSSRPEPTALSMASPADLRWSQSDFWGSQSTGLAVAFFAFAFWGFALVRKRITLRYGVMKGLDLMVASIVRPARKTKGRLKPAPRKMRADTYWFAAATLVAWALILIGWFQGGAVWQATLTSVIGMATGGGIVWAIRIAARIAMGREGMGFGDVTLMGMIGAFLGWQPAVLIFGLAPFTALAIAVAQAIFTRNPVIAFGPYLCAAAVIVYVGWDRIWNDWASRYLFLVGDMLLGVALVFLVLACVLLWLIAGAKRRFSQE